MDKRLDGWMNGWRDGWINLWRTDDWMNDWIPGWMNKWTDGWMNKWTDGWMKGLTVGWMNKWTDEWVNGINRDWWTDCMIGGWMNLWTDTWMDGWTKWKTWKINSFPDCVGTLSKPILSCLCLHVSPTLLYFSSLSPWKLLPWHTAAIWLANADSWNAAAFWQQRLRWCSADTLSQCSPVWPGVVRVRGFIG